MIICKFCDVPYEPKTLGQSFCSVRCNKKVRAIMDAYTGGRLPQMSFPRGQVDKVMKIYNIPILGINFDEGRNSFSPKHTSRKIQY